MNCPSCKTDSVIVTDSRAAMDGDTVRRRRRCVTCSHRFTTIEVITETGQHARTTTGSFISRFDAAQRKAREAFVQSIGGGH